MKGLRFTMKIWLRIRSQAPTPWEARDLETRETNATFSRAGLWSTAPPGQDSIGIGQGRSESTGKADSNNPMAGWRRSAGRRFVRKRAKRRRCGLRMTSAGVRRNASASRTSRARTPRWTWPRARPLWRTSSGGVHWSTRG